MGTCAAVRLGALAPLTLGCGTPSKRQVTRLSPGHYIAGVAACAAIAALCLQLLCDAVSTELTCWHKLHAHGWLQQQQQQQHQQGVNLAVGLQALLQHNSSHEQQQQQQDIILPLSFAQQQEETLPGCNPTRLQPQQQQQQQQPCLQQQCPPGLQRQQQQRCMSAPGAPQRLPVVGYCMDEITCLACGDRWVL